MTDDRIPPNDQEAEMATLGSVLFDPAALDDVTSLVSANDFYAEAHRILFATVRQMVTDGIGVDPVTIASQLNTSGRLAAVGGVPHIMRVIQSVPHAAHAEHYARIVKQHSQRRQAIEAARNLERQAFDLAVDPSDFMGAALDSMSDAMDASQEYTIPDLATDLFEIGDSIDKAINGEPAVGLLTGLDALDAKTHGVFPGQLCIVAARPGCGKTSFVTSWLNKMARWGKAALFFSLEMTRADIIRRILSIKSNVPFEAMLTGEIDHQQRYAIEVASMDLSESQLIIDDRPGLTVEDLEIGVRYWKRRKPIEAVFIDHASLIGGRSKNGRYDKMSTIADDLLILAKTIDLPVILLCQLNRKIEERKGREKRPKMSDLRDSGAFEQNVNHIWMLHREVVNMQPGDAGYDDEKGRAEVFVEKNRNGAAPLKVDLQFDGPTMQFRNLAHYHDPGSGF